MTIWLQPRFLGIAIYRIAVVTLLLLILLRLDVLVKVTLTH